MTSQLFSLGVERWALSVGRFLLPRSAFGVWRLPGPSSLSVGRFLS